MSGFYSSLPPRRVPMCRTAGVPTRSARTRSEAPLRAAIVAAELERAGWRCCRCGGPASEGHEPAFRSRYPGSHLNPGLVVASCRACNEFAVLHPAAAESEGWAIPSGLSVEDAVAATAQLKRAAA